MLQLLLKAKKRSYGEIAKSLKDNRSNILGQSQYRKIIIKINFIPDSNIRP